MSEFAAGMLEFLCCPVRRDDLRLEESGLVSVSAPHRRYRIERDIPILLPPTTEEQRAGGVDSIIRAFEERSASYYADNYESSVTSQRSRRLELVGRLLSQLARPGVRVLDVGSGPAVLGEVAQRQNLEYVAVDL